MFIKMDCYQFAERMSEDFSRDAAMALFDWLEELESDCGDPQEFDRIAIRCEFCEYPSAMEAAQEYGWQPEADLYDADDNERPEDEIKEENEEAALEWLQRRTSVIEFEGGVVMQKF